MLDSTKVVDWGDKQGHHYPIFNGLSDGKV